MMQKQSWRIYLVPLFLFAFIMASGCTQNTAVPQEGGITKLGAAGELIKPTTMQESFSKINELFGVGQSGINQSIPVYFIQGKGVNSDGFGEQWIFGIEYQDVRYFARVESSQVILIPTTVDLPTDEIYLQSVFQPKDLITSNKELIKNSFNTSVVDVELMNAVYAMTSVEQENMKILYFNATTGKQIWKSS
jgi:hypothetical protein